ncbi:L-threonylcarbamoyladenylate synthase [Maridesulfovibrio bastinii]|uniref:L-threonylcarbamoyladenylate synthase n=1 Tax=Maridesulfovibrio bastinii TaxID=47157 RepID=UPI0003FB5BF3|nr:L-threonylcarbamoyladenylate synthase [Maridesulfovibrio bastinii]
MNFEEALPIISTGGVIIYPTETLYALGAEAMDEGAAKRIMIIKGRPISKPLPLIIGKMDQLDQVTDNVTPEILRLARQFWPGPLSIIVKAKSELPLQVKDAEGFTSVRWTSHPSAEELCLKSRSPLIATSANKSGESPAAVPAEVTAELAALVDGVVDCEPYPHGGDPSTVVKALPGGKVVILRYGVVTKADLVQAGFTVVN